MPRRERSADTDKQKRPERASGAGREPRGVAPHDAKPGAWASVNKLGDGKKIGSRRKLPYGPLGGSGRKTNLSRSS